MSGSSEDDVELRPAPVCQDLEGLQEVLHEFQTTLQRQLSETIANMRTQVREELDLFHMKAAGAKDPWSLRASSPQPRGKSCPPKDARFDQVVPLEPGSEKKNDLMSSSVSLSVVKACAKFRAPKVKPRMPSVRSNTVRLPDLVEEMQEVRLLRKAEEEIEEHVHKRTSDQPSSPGKRSTNISMHASMLGNIPSLPERMEAIPQAPQQAPRTRRAIGSILVNAKAQTAMCVVIFLHALCMLISSEVMSRNVMSATPPVFIVLEVIFFLLFAIETGLCIYVYRVDWFRRITSQGKKNPGRWWNCAECFLVVSQLFDIVMQIQVDVSPTRMTLFRTVRLLRLIRIIRVFKVVRAVRDLRLILYSMTRSFTVFFWSVVALFLSTLMFAMIFTEVVLHYKLRYADRNTEGLDRYFGSLTASSISLLQAVTGGVDWGEVLEEVASLDHPIASVALIVYICFALFALMNVITGVFLHTAMDRAKEEREIFMVRNARKVFAAADHGKNGMITWPDFERALNSTDVTAFFAEIDLEVSEARNLFDLLDTTGDGVISAEEFLYGCLRLSGVAKAFDLLVLSREVAHLLSLISTNGELILENQQLMLAHFAIQGKHLELNSTHLEEEKEDTPGGDELTHAKPELPGTCHAPGLAATSNDGRIQK